MSLQRQIVVWVFLCAALVYVLYALSGVLLPFVAGMTISYLLNPLADKLERMGLNRVGATSLILALFVVILLVLAIIFVPILARQFTAFLLNLPSIAARLQSLAVEEGGKLVQRYGGETLKTLGFSGGLTPAEVQNSIGSVVGQVSSYLLGFLNQIWSGSRALFGLFSLLVVTPVVAFYLLLDWKRMIAAVDGWIPLQQRDNVRSIARDIDAALAGFVRGQSLVSLFLGLWYSIGLTGIGLNFGFLIGISGGLLSFVPYVGSLTVLMLAVAVALVQSFPDWRLLAETVAVVVAGQFLEGNVLSPNLVGASIGLHPVWLMFALVACSALFGFTGLLVAVPLAAAAGVLSRFALRKYLKSPLYTGDIDEPSAAPGPSFGIRFD